MTPCIELLKKLKLRYTFATIKQGEKMKYILHIDTKRFIEATLLWRQP